MSLRSKLWTIATNVYPTFLRKVYGMHIGKGVRIAYRAHLDKSVNPHGIHIGDRTWVLNGAFILAHDHCRHLKTNTYIGHDCVIGINAIIMPGIHIGNQVIIGSGSIVTKDIPDNCVAVGNPAKIIKTGVEICNGQIVNTPILKE